MQHLDFKLFSKAVENQFTKLSTNPDDYVLLKLNIDTDLLWQKYLSLYPKELNTIFRERKHYDGNYDKNFVRKLGSVIALDVDLNIQTVWNVETEGYFQDVADGMRDFVLSHSKEVIGLFATSEKIAGSLSNRDNYDSNIVWDHFYAKVPDTYIKAKDVIGTYTGTTNTAFQMLYRAVKELSQDSVDLVLELAKSNSIYRGEEFKDTLQHFSHFRKKCSDYLTDDKLRCFLWWEIAKGNPLSRFRNSAIGTLVVDIEEGVDVNRAVASYESKVAPTNYKRTKSVVTPAMIKNAQKAIEELGYGDSIYRRFATESDLNVTDMLFTHQSEVALNVFDEMTKEAKASAKTLNKVDEITIEDFISKVLPTAKTVEVLFETKHKANLVALTAPQHSSSANLFKWSNQFAWAYNGDVTDAISERVKHFGGDISGKMRVSLSWHCADDLDLHLHEATYSTNGYEIYFGNRGKLSPAGGMLDLDMNGLDKKDAENPVENIIYKNTPPDGVYRVVVHNYSKKSSKSNAFTLQVAWNNEIVGNYSYPIDLPSGKEVQCLKLTVHNGDLVKVEKGKDLTGIELEGDAIWGIKTGLFHQVSKIMLSPNYWGDNAIGNKHYIFAIEGCNSDEPQRGFFNEFLKPELQEHRKVFELLGTKTKAEVTNNQVAGLGFSSTVSNEVVVRVSGNSKRVFKIKI